MPQEPKKLTFNNSDFAEMKQAERQLVDFLIKLSETCHPLLLCYTLIRCARVFVRKTDRDTQQMIIPVLNSYLRGDVKPPTGGEEPLLWTPPTVN